MKCRKNRMVYIETLASWQVTGNILNFQLFQTFLCTVDLCFVPNAINVFWNESLIEVKIEWFMFMCLYVTQPVEDSPELNHQSKPRLAQSLEGLAPFSFLSHKYLFFVLMLSSALWNEMRHFSLLLLCVTLALFATKVMLTSACQNQLIIF